MINYFKSKLQNGSAGSTDHKAYVTALLIVSFIVLVFTFNPNLGYLSDCARYYLVGQSLAAGAGFVQIWDAEQPPDGLSSPLYPLMIAALSKSVSESIILIKTMTGLFFLLSIWLYFTLFRKIGLSRTALFVTLLPLVFNYWVLKHASLMLTEIPFMFFSGAGLLFYMKSQNEDSLKDINWWIALLFTGAAFYMRSIGIALAAAIILDEFLKNRWKRAAVAPIFFIGLFFPWILRGMKLTVLTHFDIIRAVNPLEPFGAKADLLDIVRRFDINVINYISTYLSSTVVPISRWFSNPDSLFSWLLGLFVGSVTVYGMVKVGRHRTVLSSYLLLYLIVLLLFPQSYAGHRFLIPILPFLYLALYIGLRSLTEMLKISINYSSSLMVILTLLNLWSLRSLEAELSKPLLPQWRGYFEVANWAGENLPTKAVIATRIGQEFYLYSLRKTVQFPFGESGEEIINYLNYKKATHIVSDDLDYPLTDMMESTGLPLQSLINVWPESIKEVYRSANGETKLFELILFPPIKSIEGGSEKK